jgi:fructose-bisphosphate aldolase, class I
MRSRIVTSPSLNGDRILGAILFENTMDRQIEGRDAADYLWAVKQVVPFLKVDKGPDRRGRRVQCVMLKLTLPELDAFYADLVTHPNVVRVAALSGGYAARRPTPVLVITTV